MMLLANIVLFIIFLIAIFKFQLKNDRSFTMFYATIHGIYSCICCIGYACRLNIHMMYASTILHFAIVLAYNLIIYHYTQNRKR